MQRRILPLLVAVILLFSACPKPKPTPPVPVYVTVNVCTESNLLANPYCPVTEARQFVAGTQPTAPCALHKAPEPKTRVAAPWSPGGALRAWTPLLYGGLTVEFDEAKLDALYEAMSVDGINAERNFGWWTDVAGGPWDGKYLLPWNPDWSWNEAYWARLDRRLQMWCGDRDGTEIISILDACSLYAGETWDMNPLNKIAGDRPQDVFSTGPAREKVLEYARELVRRVARFKDHVILEAVNEGTQIVGFDAYADYTRAVISTLKSEGWPVDHIQVNWFDSSLFYSILKDDLEGRGLAATHQVCSEKSVDWYKTSPGKQALMALGDYPSSDGPDFYDSEGAPQGLKWFWLPAGQARRPSAEQIAYIMRTMAGLGYPRFEQLSAAAFQKGSLPDLGDAISLGRPERLAMKGN